MRPLIVFKNSYAPPKKKGLERVKRKMIWSRKTIMMQTIRIKER